MQNEFRTTSTWAEICSLNKHVPAPLEEKTMYSLYVLGTLNKHDAAVADFYAELAVLKDHIHAGHLAILEKLDTNHRELLATLERQGSRINTVESGLARVDERTSKGGRTSS